MHKWLYDRMVAEYSKKSKEELIQEIMSLQEIECSDRAFANECEAGTSVAYINALFSVLRNLEKGSTEEKMNKMFELVKPAENSWNFVKNEIHNMNDDSRCETALENCKNKFSSVIDNEFDGTIMGNRVARSEERR